MTVIPLCVRCLHRDPVPPGDEWTCAAFPAGIPEAVLLARLDHRKPIRGDHGIRYEPDFVEEAQPS